MRFDYVGDGGLIVDSNVWTFFDREFHSVETTTVEIMLRSDLTATRVIWGFRELLHERSETACLDTRSRRNSLRVPLQRFVAQWSAKVI